MATIYYESDADPTMIMEKRVAVIGYGSQGHAHALNLQDNGVNVKVGLRPGSKSIKKAEGDGVSVTKIGDAAKWADVIMMLAPDTSQPQIYQERIRGTLNQFSLRSLLIFFLLYRPYFYSF